MDPVQNNVVSRRAIRAVRVAAGVNPALALVGLVGACDADPRVGSGPDLTSGGSAVTSLAAPSFGGGRATVRSLLGGGETGAASLGGVSGTSGVMAALSLPGGGETGAASPGSVSGSSGATTARGAEFGEPCVPVESGQVPVRGLPWIWHKVEVPTTVCGNGSQYKFFVNYSLSSNNLLLSFEPGGACWDYGSCSGNGGLRGAANSDGIPDDHMSQLKWEFLPLHRRDANNPLVDWNMVFIPYCTGDLHTGNNVATYENPDPDGKDLVFRHQGHQNMLRVIEWLRSTFPNVPRLLVTGCSAGGAGSLVNYHFIRKGLPGTQCAYLLNDSGPVFSSFGYSGPLHAMVRSSWGLDPLLEDIASDFPGLDAESVKTDLGLINTALADKYRRDRLAISVFRLDYNYSLYSYETFYGFPGQAEIHRMWAADLDLLIKQYETRQNLAYFIPYFRNDNCSHCLTIPPIDSDVFTILGEPYRGTEIEDANRNVRDFIELVLDNTRPLSSFIESSQPNERLSSEKAAECEAL